MEEIIVKLKKGEGRLLKSGGLWVFDNEIESLSGTPENGSMVSVMSNAGNFLGTGFINFNSKIRIRVMTRKENQKIDDEFLENRIRDAWNYRKETVDISSCRIIFGEADYLPGLVVDKFSDVLVVQSLALGIDLLKEKILQILIDILKEDKISIRGIYERSDAKERLKEGMPRVKGFIGKEFDTIVQIVENEIKYEVDVAEGQKTGFFLDQKYNRKAIWKVCKNKKVLDCFTHTGSFALNAAKAGATSVLGVDASELGVKLAKENAILNHLEDVASFQCEDVFELLPDLEKKGDKFDVVILDPPAFTKSKDSIKKAVKGYKEINLRGMKIVKDGGYLVTCSCSHYMAPDLFRDTIAKAAKDAHKRLRQVEFRTQSPDHPILWSADESYYLKFYLFQVTDEK